MSQAVLCPRQPVLVPRHSSDQAFHLLHEQYVREELVVEMGGNFIGVATCIDFADVTDTMLDFSEIGKGRPGGRPFRGHLVKQYAINVLHQLKDSSYSCSLY